MASSSLSQEDVDHDFEVQSSRRSRIRTQRANARNVPVCRDADCDVGSAVALSECSGTCGFQDHDASPKPSSRAKDKRCPRPNHVNKGKAQRERRKLREKRRSTGVVHLPSTESTGGSTGEEEDELLSTMSAETRRNTAFNETPLDKDHTEIPDVNDSIQKSYPVRNNKSPSDLDADDEDNQDYDSTVNQSDSTLSLVQETALCELMGRSVTTNGRPETPCSDKAEELLERAREENRRILDLLKERDDRISLLEQKVATLSQELEEVTSYNRRLIGEKNALLLAMSSAKAK